MITAWEAINAAINFPYTLSFHDIIKCRWITAVSGQYIRFGTHSIQLHDERLSLGTIFMKQVVYTCVVLMPTIANMESKICNVNKFQNNATHIMCYTILKGNRRGNIPQEYEWNYLDWEYMWYINNINMNDVTFVFWMRPVSIKMAAFPYRTSYFRECRNNAQMIFNIPLW